MLGVDCLVFAVECEIRFFNDFALLNSTVPATLPQHHSFVLGVLVPFVPVSCQSVADKIRALPEDEECSEEEALNDEVVRMFIENDPFDKVHAF